MRRWPWVVGGVVAGATIILGVVLASRFGTDPSLSASPLIGKAAPEVVVTPLDGAAPFTLGSLEGDIVVVNFWASWCIPCRAEHAVLVEAARRHPNMAVIGIVYQDSAEGVARFLDEFGRGYPVTLDPGSRAAIAFGVRGVPETFFVDAAGTVVGKVNGPIDSQLMEGTLQAILAGALTGEITVDIVQPSP